MKKIDDQKDSGKPVIKIDGEKIKTVYKYDVNGNGFRRVAIFLIGLSVFLLIIGIYFIMNLFGSY